MQLRKMPRMCGLLEASRQTGLSYDCLRKLCLNDQIIYIRSGTKYLVNMDRLADFLNGESADKNEGATESIAVAVAPGNPFNHINMKES